MPLVSVIMPTYNSEDTVVRAIESVLGQTYLNWELLITDDGSTDRTSIYLKAIELQDRRIQVVYLEKNVGAGLARNRSIENASGRYIAFLDSDDSWHPEKLERHVMFMIRGNVALSYTAYNVYDIDNQFVRTVKIKNKVTIDDMLKSNYIGCSTAIYDVSLIGKFYMSSIRKRQDYGLWFSILSKTGEAYGLNETLTKYWQLPGSVSSNKFRLIGDQYKFFNRELKLGFFKSVMSTVYSIIYKIFSIKDNGK